MSRRVRTVVAALFALILVLQAPVALAVPWGRETGPLPGFFQRIVQTIQKVLKPLAAIVNDDEEAEFKPTPPKP